MAHLDRAGATQQYNPLAHSAFWLQYQLWGESYLGYHLANIALHASSAWLILLILQRLHVRGAWLAALIFAVHPVHVESVAWMSELKNTLSTSLYLCAVLFYVRFDERRKHQDYIAALALFAAALLTKTVTASLPAALLIVFWWQRGTVRWRQDVVPLLPFFILGASAGLLTAWVEHTYIGEQGPGGLRAPAAALQTGQHFRSQCGRSGDSAAAFLRDVAYAVDAYSNLGVALLRAGRLAEAQTVLEQALRIQPGHREATINLAIVQLEIALRAGPRLR
ncbi:MAG TPA: tetratricopeptide repeat protein [Longimicrobiales bacterium]